MREKIKRLWYSAAGKASIVLFVASMFLCILSGLVLKDACFSEKKANFISNILIGVGINLIGIIVTILFVQYFIDKQDEKEARLEETRMILRYDRHMKTLIRRYLMFYQSVTTRLEDRSNIEIDQVLKRTFQLRDMADMYHTSLYISEGFQDSSISLFFQAEEELRNYMLKMLENIEFKYNPELEDLLESYIEKSIDFDVRGHILECERRGQGEHTERGMIEKALKDESQDWMAQFERGELKSTILYPYILLFFLLYDQKASLIKYRELIKSMGKDEKVMAK